MLDDFFGTRKVILVDIGGDLSESVYMYIYEPSEMYIYEPSSWLNQLTCCHGLSSSLLLAVQGRELMDFCGFLGFLNSQGAGG